MILKIQKDLISKALNISSKGLPSRTPVEALYQIKFEATDRELILVSSNSDLTIKQTLLANPEALVIEKPGTVLLPGRQLVELVKRFKEGWVTFSFIEGAVLVKNGKSKFTLKTGEVATYPDVLTHIGAPTQVLNVDGNQLIQLFKETIPFTAVHEARPVLTGVNFKVTPTHWICTSTDSFRLSKVEVEHGQTVETPIEVVIPREALGDLIKLFPVSKEDQVLTLSFYPGHVIFETADLLVSARLINEVFPDTRAFVPTTFQQVVGVERSALLDLVDRLLLLADGTSTVILTLLPETGLLNLVASQECGRAEEEIEGEGIDSLLKIAFNGKFFKEAIQSLSGETLHLSFNGDGRPFVLTSPNQEHSIRLIVPMRLS